MPATYEALRARLARLPLPTSLPIADVIVAMEAMGYTLTVSGSHHHFRKPGARRVTMAVHDKRITRPAVKELAALIQAAEQASSSRQ